MIKKDILMIKRWEGGMRMNKKEIKEKTKET